MSVNTSPRLISVQLVGLDEDLGPDLSDVIRALADRVADDRSRDRGRFPLAEDASKREQKTGTGVARRHRDPALPDPRRCPSRPSRCAA